MGMIRTVFSYACDNDLLPSNPCEGVKVKLPRNAPPAREPLDADDLHRIFSHPYVAAFDFVQRHVPAQDPGYHRPDQGFLFVPPYVYHGRSGGEDVR